MESILLQRKTGFIDTKERPIAATRVGELLEEEIEESTQKQIKYKEEKKWYKYGEFVRTKQGYIAKLERISEDNMYWFDDTIYCDYEAQPVLWETRLEEITKHSFNIIDLIEIGDYVNGEIVSGFNEINNKRVCLFVSNYEFNIYPEGILTIVTKEQFKAMEYRVGGEDD